MTLEEIYRNNIIDIAMEISISNEWRRKIFALNKDEVLKISYLSPNELPDYVRDIIVSNKLTFFVEITTECDEEFDDGLVIFKFSAKEYPNIVCFSGNNPEIPRK